MTWLRTVLVVYALFLAGAGIQGFVSKDSLPSLLGGVGGGVVVLAAVALSKQRMALGFGLALVVGLAMIGRFLPAFLKADNPTEAIWPHLVLTIASALVAGLLVGAHFMSRRPASQG